jgi:thiopurine S-methyltransferase
MQPKYWHERWEEGRIGFHRLEANPQLVEHHKALDGVIRVLVPLCGKSVDLEWLVVQGFEVVGIELSELAAQAFFSERGFVPERRERGSFVELSHGNVAILVGDFFAARGEELGYFDGVYDRAAMIALPPDLRARYVAHLQTLLTPKARLLLITLHFDAEGGPPFSVPPEEVTAAYSGASVTSLASVDGRADAPGPVERGATFVHENVYGIQFPESSPAPK